MLAFYTSCDNLPVYFRPPHDLARPDLVSRVGEVSCYDNVRNGECLCATFRMQFDPVSFRHLHETYLLGVTGPSRHPSPPEKAPGMVHVAA